jgi:tRNA 2-selenouridine synthase
MSIKLVSAAEALVRYADFSTVIDARSEAEYAEDSLPRAVNWPTLNNAERHAIGTMYKQVSAFDAKKYGAALAAANIARHIEREVLNKPKDWAPLVYCWRGGKRSNALALILSEIGFRVSLIDGGYKAFRSHVMDDTPKRVAPLQFQVLCGPTGSGKTRLLHELHLAGAQVVDLEALARHRSSVLGRVPGTAQPSQRRFESDLWAALAELNPAYPVFIEAESRKVGNVAVPECLMLAMRKSPCWRMELPLAERVHMLLEDYTHFTQDPSSFSTRLDTLVTLRGHAQVDAWKLLIERGSTPTVVEQLLTVHYDPGYQSSTERNFKQFKDAQVVQPQSSSRVDMATEAQRMMAVCSHGIDTGNGHRKSQL